MVVGALVTLVGGSSLLLREMFGLQLVNHQQSLDMLTG